MYGCGDHQAGPVFVAQPLEDGHHLREVVADAPHHLRLGEGAERLRVLVERIRHDEQAVGGRSLFAGAGHLEGLQVALGDVGHVADDVAHLPVAAGGRLLPVLRDLGELEHALGFFPDGAQQVLLAGGVGRVPFGRDRRRLRLCHGDLLVLTNEPCLRMMRELLPDCYIAIARSYAATGTPKSAEAAATRGGGAQGSITKLPSPWR